MYFSTTATISFGELKPETDITAGISIISFVSPQQKSRNMSGISFKHTIHDVGAITGTDNPNETHEGPRLLIKSETRVYNFSVEKSV